MAYKTTKKVMKNEYDQIIKVGFCNLQNLLKFQEPFAYSTRSEGWACDYYNINGILISTGYAPLESKNTKSTYDICKKYDNKAEKIIYDYSLSYEEMKSKVDTLLIGYINEVTK